MTKTTWTSEPPTKEGCYLVRWNPLFSPSGVQMHIWSESCAKFEMHDGSIRGWSDAVIERSADAIQPYGLCGCGRVLYPMLKENGEQIGTTHPDPDDDEHHSMFWCGATPADVVGPDNARKLGLL